MRVRPLHRRPDVAPEQFQWGREAAFLVFPATTPGPLLRIQNQRFASAVAGAEAGAAAGALCAADCCRGAAAAALGSGFTISILPLKYAPSSMIIRAVLMSPTSLASLRISILSLASTFPCME